MLVVLTRSTVNGSEFMPTCEELWLTETEASEAFLLASKDDSDDI
jgi:hypothetical protein